MGAQAGGRRGGDSIKMEDNENRQQIMHKRTWKCAECFVGCIGVGDGICSNENSDGWKNEKEAYREHLEGCLQGFEISLNLMPVNCRRERRELRVNIAKVKTALEALDE